MKHLIYALTALGLVVASLQAEHFKKCRLLIQTENGKSKQVSVRIDVDDEALVISGKRVGPMRLEFSRITSIEYERSTHPRWKTAIFVSPLFLLSKSKHHWLNIQAEDGKFAILRLDKKEQQLIRALVESRWGREIKTLLPK